MQIMTHAVPEKTYYWTMFYAIIVRHPMGSRAINSVGAYIQRWLCTLYPTGTKHTIRRYAASVFGHAGDDSPFYLSALFTYTLPVGISSATISVCGIVWHQLFCLQNCRSYLSGRGFHLSLLSPYSLERAFQNVRPTRFSFADRQHILLGVC